MKLFSNSLHRDQWRWYLKRLPIESYKKGEIILLQGEVPRNVYIIKKGVVKTYGINNDGDERPVSFDAVGEIFPIGWLFEKIDRTQYFYQALTDCEVYAIPRKTLLRYWRLHPKMGYEMYATLAARFVTLQARIYALEQSKANEKIVYTLLYLAERFGASASASGTTKLSIPLTQQELANYIGLTRETTSVELKKLERMKAIKYSRYEYQVNLPKLRSIVE